MNSSVTRFVLAAFLASASVLPLGAAYAASDAAAASDAKTSDVKTGDAKPADSKTSETKASDTKTADATPKKRSKAEIEAFLTKCSDEADEKGLLVSRGKGAARKAFRRQCMHRFGVDPR